MAQSRTSNEVNEITDIDNTVGAPWAEPAYDPNGNMTTIPQPADPTESFAATYDAWNRLVRLTDGEEGPVVQEYQYDGRGYRIVTKTYDDTETLLENRQAYFAIAHDFRTVAGAGIMVPEGGPNCGRTSETATPHVQR